MICYGDEAATRRLAYELQRDGWLGQLRTRHAWEFLPAARGGAYSCGDRFIEFRAQQAVNPGWRGVLAMETAAIPPRVVGIAARPSSYHDVAGLGQWLPDAVTRVNLDTVISMLETKPHATAQRAAYLLGSAGNHDARAALVAAYPAAQTAWFGPRTTGGVFDPKTKVNDTLLHQYLTVGAGS